eukprot:XP_019930479.1 PREDICTED: uncharacterized protein LOC105347304 isoform X2 [Crassostrea gigas]
MAASECAKFCVVLFTIAIALVSASKSDIRKDVIDVQDYITLRNLVKELQVTLKVHESRFEMLENRLLQSERKTDLLVRERKRNLQVINELSRHLSGIENKEAQIKPFAKRLLVAPTSPTEQVAFYVHLTTSLPSPGANQIIKFDHVMVNIGNGYHNNTGVFIVPTSGVYVFSWSIRLNGGSVHSAELVINNETHGKVYLDSSHLDGHVSAGSIARLQAGDDVYMRVKAGVCHNRGAIFSDVCGWSSFMGWKISSL